MGMTLADASDKGVWRKCQLRWEVWLEMKTVSADERGCAGVHQ